jgi:hypothetical protein
MPKERLSGRNNKRKWVRISPKPDSGFDWSDRQIFSETSNLINKLSILLLTDHPMKTVQRFYVTKQDAYVRIQKNKMIKNHQYDLSKKLIDHETMGKIKQLKQQNYEY